MRVLEQLFAPFRRPLVTTKYPATRPSLDDRGSRGTPTRLAEACSDDRACEEACPTAAITITESADITTWRLDYGRCIFCGECSRACTTGAITTTCDFELAVTERAGAVASNPAPRRASR
jgi:formate hydrogenlyase subunit 6/NADH:ubiquinone oxidoreductase subunit I